MNLLPLLYQLVRLEIELWNATDSTLRADHDLALGRFEAMRAVAAVGEGCRVQDVAERLSLTVGATSKLIDRLENSGFVTRSPNPDDRRSSLLALTPSGTEQLRSAEATLEAALQGWFAPVLPDGGESLVAELGALRTALAAGVAR